jgi:hypothetical protein
MRVFGFVCKMWPALEFVTIEFWMITNHPLFTVLCILESRTTFSPQILYHSKPSFVCWSGSSG